MSHATTTDQRSARPNKQIDIKKIIQKREGVKKRGKERKKERDELLYYLAYPHGSFFCPNYFLS